MKITFFTTVLILSFFNLSGQAPPQDVFMKFDYEEDSGKLFLYVPDNIGQFIYVNYLSSGLGSNDIGLDRGQIGDTRVVQFEKYGDKLLLVEDNLEYRAVSDNLKEQQAVKEAFAKSILESFKIVETKAKVFKIDITSFILSDAHDIVQKLKRQKEGNYKLNASRSVIEPRRCKSFPRNVEFEGLVTFEGDSPGANLRSVVADSRSFTLGLHHSFVALPEPGYTPRKFHPASGYFPMSYQDYAVPIEEDITQRLIYRHRLVKKNPDQATSEPIEPIVYYIDQGCPEPIKSALMEGASWWNAAFEAAGFLNAFQIKELPEGADPLDVRYNMIQWVHRSTRGWSYGAMVADPRTGEIIKGHVSLGSLRVRQDYLIIQGLLSPFDDQWSWEDENPMKVAALARLRQLAAHEVGHTLGLAHNFAASTQDRASVMDYPHPKIGINENREFDLSEAYDDKIGRWDVQAIKYGYQLPTPSQDEDALLDSILAESAKMNLRYISDSDARPASSAHGYAHLWDNSELAFEEFGRVKAIRLIALRKMGENSIATGTPYSELEKVWTPIYMMHRYQLEAMSKLIAGYEYNYAAKGSGAELLNDPISEDIQKAAINSMLKSLTPHFLAPTDVVDLILPPSPGYPTTRESTSGLMGAVFDPTHAATIVMNHSISLMMVPERLNRIDYHHRKYDWFSVGDYLDEIEKSIQVFSLEYSEEAMYIYLSYMMHAIKQESTSVRNKIALEKKLRQIQLKNGLVSYWSRMIDDFWEEGTYPKLYKDVVMPPGSPIGCSH